MTYDNGVTDMTAPHNRDSGWSKYRMDQMWEWVLPAFRKTNILKQFSTPWNLSGDPRHRLDSLHVKNVFLNIFINKGIEPLVSPKDVDYYYKEKIEKFFDLKHEQFNNKNFSIITQSEEIDKDFKRR